METAIENLLCFDLSFDENLGSFMPAIYLATATDCEYISKKVVLHNAADFGINFGTLPTFYNVLFSLATQFNKEVLLKKFDKTKKIKSIADLKKNTITANLIIQFLESKLHQFLIICTQNKLKISVNLGLNKDFYKAQLAISNQILEPILYFGKNTDGIEYCLQLADYQNQFYPSNHSVELIVNEPSWVVIDKKLYQINHINSNKLRPFLKTKSVFIANKIVPEYFEKFVKKTIEKVSIHASGFEVETKNIIQKCSVHLLHNFFKNRYELSLQFEYYGYTFSSNSNKMTHTLIEIPTLETIKVVNFKRNVKQEAAFKNVLISFGLNMNDEYNFYCDSSDEFAVVQFVINNKNLFQQHHFDLQNLKIDEKIIHTDVAVLIAEKTDAQDWFDLQMTIICGDHQFSFTKIVSNIKNKNRLYALNDGSFFLIPLEWTAQFLPVLNFARIENDKILLPKVNSNLLENTTHFKNENSIIPSDFEISYLVKAKLRPYQIEGVKWLFNHYKNNLGACLADDMGLGKTLQTLACLVMVQNDITKNSTVAASDSSDLFSEITPKLHALKALIVLPSSLLFNWYNEAKKYTPHFKMVQYIGNKRSQITNRLKNYDLIFTSYNIISKDIAMLEKMSFNYLILDESQYIKNKNSQVFKNINKLSAAHKISLSGTPIENSLSDLWAQMQFINPNILGTYKFFQSYFQTPVQLKNDQNKIDELKQIINPFILRRTKKQVLSELPDYSETIFLTEMSIDQEIWYEKEKSKARNSLLHIDANTNKVHILNSLMKLRQLSNHPKMILADSDILSGKFDDATNYLQTLVKSSQKVLIFSSFVSHLKLYKSWCVQKGFNYCYLTGETAMPDRETEVNRFKNNENISLFFLSVGAANVGLNLQEATYVVFLDPWWNPFKEIQAISRAHRMGQKYKVEVVKFIAKNSIEEKIVQLQNSKKLLAEHIIDDNFLHDVAIENLEYLLQ